MFNYSLRFSLAPTVDFEERMTALLDFCQMAKIDDVMFFVAPKELNCGHITIEEAKKWTDVILRAKKILKENGITMTLNPWITISHYDLGVGFKEGQNFRAMVGHDGATAQISICPLDSEWRKYYVDLMNFYVETLEPDLLWIEDDMRLDNHMPIGRGCFCEEHMKLYNARLGTNYDRETFVAKMDKDKTVRKVYLDVARETIEDTVKYIVENTKGQKKFGLMTGGALFHQGRRFGNLFSTMAMYGAKPQNRCCLCSYRQRGLQEYAWSFNTSPMLVKSLTNNYADCVSEIENVPHSMYTKSANYFRYQMVTAAPMLFTGATFSMFEFCGNGANNYERYGKMLASIKPYLSAVNDLGLSYDDAVGVRVLINEDSAYTKNAESDNGSIAPKDYWIYAYLTQLGIACAYTCDENIKGHTVAISGQVLRNYDDETVIALFKNNFVVLTAENVVVLNERGLGYLIDMNGCEYYRQRISGKYSFEEINSDDKIFGISKFRATGQMFCGDYLHINYGDGDKTVYSIVKDFKEDLAGNAITKVNNALVVPYKDNDTEMDIFIPIGMLCPLRDYVIKKALLEQSPYQDEFVYIAEENVCPYVYKKDGITYIFCVNFVDDDYSQLHLKMPMQFKSICVLREEDISGKTVQYERNGDDYIISEPLKAQSSYVLVCK